MAEYRDFTENELKWIKSFEQVMAKAPGTLFLFAGAGLLVIYPLNEDGKRYMEKYGAVDGYAPSISVPTKVDVSLMAYLQAFIVKARYYLHFTVKLKL